MCNDYVIQLTTEPVEHRSYMSAVDLIFADRFYEVASHVEGFTERAVVLDTLKSELANNNPFVEWHEDHFILRAGFLTEHYREGYERCRKAIARLNAELTLESYANGDAKELIDDVIDNYDDIFGFYVYDGQESPITLDKFLRSASLDTPYYFGGVADYVC